MALKFTKFSILTTICVVAQIFCEPILFAAAPVVSNVTAAQRMDGSKMVDVRYDLYDSDSILCDVSIAVSSNNGSTWTVPAPSLTGDIGGTIPPGKGKLITWDCAKDLPGSYGTNYRTKVIADDYSVPSNMIPIFGGTFQMGDSFNEGHDDELPVHTITLDSFYMSQYEITNGQFCQFLNSVYQQGLITVNGIVSGTDHIYCDSSEFTSWTHINFSNGLFSVRTKNGRDMTNDPIVEVSWYGAIAYCNWRSRQEGRQECYNLSTGVCNATKKGYRLPTEAEWEYAARGGLSKKRFPWGNTISHNQANYYSMISYSYDISLTRGFHPTWNNGVMPLTSPVGSFASAGYGLCDMAGNVWEWCNDWYSDSYYNISPTNNPTGPSSDSYRVLRGGSYDFSAYECRVSNRKFRMPSEWDGYIGFRILLDLN